MILTPNSAPAMKPAGFARVNPHHPLAPYVICAHYMYPQYSTPGGICARDSGPYRLDLFERSGTANPMTAGAYGSQYTQPNAATSAQILDAPPLTPASKCVSIVARVQSLSVSAGGQDWVCIRGLSNPLSYWLCLNGTSVDGCGFRTAGGLFTSGKTTNVSGDGKWHVVGGTIRLLTASTSEAAYYVDGRLDHLTSGLTDVMPVITASPLNIGLWDGNSAHMNGNIESLVLLNVALSPASMAKLSGDLYSLITPPRRIIGKLHLTPVTGSRPQVGCIAC